MSTPMTPDDLRTLLPELEAFYARFHRFFGRRESRAMGGKYLVGLTLPIERKNVENIAEQVEATPRKLQQFLSDSPWDDEGCVTELQHFIGEQFGAPNGVLVLDDTGFAKKGTHSAGVGRQYSGTLGRTDNCQVGVFLGYASAHGHTLIDRRLYVMRNWFDDPAKRQLPEGSAARRAGVQNEARVGRGDAAGVHGHRRAALPVGHGGRRVRAEPRSAPGGRRSWPLVLLRGALRLGGLATAASLGRAGVERPRPTTLAREAPAGC